MRCVAIGCLCAGALAAAGCADGPGGFTSPSASAATSGLALSASPRSGDLHVEKNCEEYHGAVGETCRITASNVKAIEVGSMVVYAQPLSAGVLDSDVVLDTPGPGNNKAFGHCHLDLGTADGLCTFSGGTGKFTGFEASARISYLRGFDWAWDGTYSFNAGD